MKKILWPPDVKNWLLESQEEASSWCWERLKSGGEGDDRGWDGWMASPTWWILVWVTPGVGDGQGGLACWDFWTAYMFLIRWVMFVWYSHLLKNFPLCCDPHILLRSMKQMLFWNCLTFFVFQQMLPIWSLVHLLFLNPACTSGSSWFTYWWSLLLLLRHFSRVRLCATP